MGLIALLILFSILYKIVYCFFENRPTLGIVLFASIFSPKIALGSIKLDGLYLVIFLLFALSIYKFKYNWIIPNKKTFYYLLTVFLVMIINVTSWYIFNSNQYVNLISSTFGSCKFVALTYFTYILNINYKKTLLLKDFKNFILLSLIVNVIAVAFEILNPSFMTNFLSNIYLNQGQMEFFEAATMFGVFSRYYGLFSYPMNMGMFMAYLILYASAGPVFNNKEKIFVILSALLLGIASNSKSFIFGFAISIILIIIIIIMNYKDNIVYTLFKVSGFIIMLLSISLYYDGILEYVRNNISVITAHYMESITHPELLLSSRLDSSTGSLVETMRIINEYWFIGVGPDSINGELIIDNAYLVLLHNGGIIALLVVVLYYIYLMHKCRNKSYYVCVLFLILCTAVGFPVLICSNVTHWFLTICMLDETY